MISAIINYYRSIINISIVLICPILIFSCSEDKPTEPNDSQNNGNVVATATIGTEGGIISGEGISISIPSGTFTQQANIKIYSIDELPFDEGVATERYSFEGFPTEFSKPLRFAIKHNGNLDEESFLAFKAEAYDDLFEESFEFYNLIEAVDSSGYLVALIYPDINNNIGLAKNMNLRGIEELLGISTKKTESVKSSHFEILYSGGLEEIISIDRIKLLWEDYFSLIYEDFGMRFDLDENDLFYVSIMSHSFGKESSKYIAKNGDLFIMNYDFITNNSGLFSKELDYWVPHYLFKASMEYYKQNNAENFVWLENAIETWIMLQRETYLQEELLLFVHENLKAPFQGIGTGSNLNKYHGFGMSTLIEFLTSFKVDDKSLLKKSDFGNIFEQINQGSNEIAALLNTVNGSIEDWWPEFFKYYIGELYEDSDFFSDQNNISGTWSINSSSDNLKEFPMNYPDLSAKLFEIQLNDANMDSDTKLTVEVTGESKVLIFEESNNKLNFLQMGSSLELLKLKEDYYDAGKRKLFITVINSGGEAPYSGSSSITLDLKTEQEIVLPFIACEITISVDLLCGKAKDVDSGDETELCEYYKIPKFNNTLAKWYNGEFNGKTFQGTLIYSGNGVTQNGEVTIVLNSTNDTVKSMNLTLESKYNDTNNGTGSNTVIEEFAATDIPLVQNNTQGFVFEVHDNMCNNIKLMRSVHSNDIYINTLNTPECNINSSRIDVIRISF